MTTMTPAACKAAIQTLISTVPNAGSQIHKQRRILRDEKAIKRYCYDPDLGRICAWFISPAASNTTVTVRNPGFAAIGTKGGGHNQSVFQFQVEAYYGLDDANDSEQAFTDLIWAACDEFNAYGGLPDVPGLIEQLPADIETFGYAMLAGVPLVHFARLRMGFRGK